MGDVDGDHPIFSLSIEDVLGTPETVEIVEAGADVGPAFVGDSLLEPEPPLS